MEGHMVAGSVLRTEDRAGKKTHKNFLTLGGKDRQLQP